MLLSLSRRSMLLCLGAVAAPAVVRASSLMPVSAKLILPDPVLPVEYRLELRYWVRIVGEEGVEWMPPDEISKNTI